MKLSQILLLVVRVALALSFTACDLGGTTDEVEARIPVFDVGRYDNPFDSAIIAKSVSMSTSPDGYTLISTDGDFFPAIAEAGVFVPLFKGVSDIQKIPATASTFDVPVNKQPVSFEANATAVGFHFSGVSTGSALEVDTDEGASKVSYLAEDYIFDFQYNDGDPLDIDGVDDIEEDWTLYKYFEATGLDLDMETFHAEFSSRFYQYIRESEMGNGAPGDGHAAIATTEFFKTSTYLGVLTYDLMTEDYDGVNGPAVTPHTYDPKTETLTSMRSFLAGFNVSDFDIPLASSIYIQFVVYDISDGSVVGNEDFTDYTTAENAVDSIFGSDFDLSAWSID